MKITVAILLSCFALSLSSISFAQCGSCEGDRWRDGYYNSCPDCQCTDRGYRYNYCISKSEYCEAFGNIGAR